MSSQLSSAVSAFRTATEPQISSNMELIDSMLKSVAAALSDKSLTSTDALAALDHLRVARGFAAKALDPRTEAEREAEALVAVEAIRKASEPEDEPNLAPVIPDTESADETENIEAAESTSG